MAHPYAEHRADDRARADRLVGRTGYADGGAVDRRQDAAMVSRGVHEHEAALHRGAPKTKLHLDGAAPKQSLAKRARGGKLGRKGTTVQVIVAPQAGKEPVPVPVPMGKPLGMGAPPPPPAAMMPPGGMPPPGAMPPGGPPMMPRARGGKVPDMTAGAMSGPGRIEKMHEYGTGGFKPKKRMVARG